MTVKGTGVRSDVLCLEALKQLVVEIEKGTYALTEVHIDRETVEKPLEERTDPMWKEYEVSNKVDVWLCLVQND